MQNMKNGEKIRVSSKSGQAYFCHISSILDDEVIAAIDSADETGTELDNHIVLYQGLPKGDKMELIIQKAVELGDGAEAARHTGSENNDPFRMENGKVVKTSNHSGGTLGGMSDGSPLLIRAYVKPTPSIFRPQQTVNCSGENTELTIRGRHDPIIVPRAVVVMECMTAITVLDAMMMNMSAKLDSLVEFYR